MAGRNRPATTSPEPARAASHLKGRSDSGGGAKRLDSTGAEATPLLHLPTRFPEDPNSELWFNEGTALDHAFEPGEVVGSSLIQIGGAFATYGIGSWIGKPGVAELGRDLVRVQLLTQGITQLVKHTARRTRPDGSSRSSFPSGHASGTFASATVLQRHYGWKVGIPAFGVASYVAASRLAENKHFLSDVVFGATIGLTAGRTVTFGRGSTRFELSPMAAQGGVGVQVSVFKLP